mgnify:CR=1 FL=1
MKSQYEHIIHPFPPLYDNNSKILILGSLPSVKSREQMFFYGHPQNRFWKVITAVINNSGMNDKNIEVPVTIEEKKMMLHNNHIALWDTIYSCDIIGSSDSSIKNAVPADISRILKAADIQTIIANGGTAFRLYGRYCEPVTGRPAALCPSTSPANAAFSLERLSECWSKFII